MVPVVVSKVMPGGKRVELQAHVNGGVPPVDESVKPGYKIASCAGTRSRSACTVVIVGAAFTTSVTVTAGLITPLASVTVRSMG